MSAAVHTVLLDFSIESTRINNEDGREKILTGILDVLQETPLKGISREAGQLIAPNVFVAVYKDVLVTIRFQDSHGLVTLNIEYMHKAEDDHLLFSYEVE